MKLRNGFSTQSVIDRTTTYCLPLHYMCLEYPQKVITYGTGNPSPGLGQAQKCSWVQSLSENMLCHNEIIL